MNLSDYIKGRPRGALTELARGIGANVPDVSMWVRGERPIPLERAVAIERFTGGEVTRKDLFPATWQRIWPELAKPGKKGAR